MPLDLAGITKKYRRQSQAAVSDINLILEPGRITALTGASGSGKTTLLRLIAGFEHPDLGTIRYNGDRYADSRIHKKPQNRSITMIFQDLALFPHLTAKKNVHFGMKRVERSRRDDISRSLFAQVQMTGFEDKYPHELSGGQRQRVALARALASKADIILMDEPFSNLDSELKWGLIDDIRSILSDAGKTVLFVTHDRDEAFFLADDIAVLHEGRLLQYGNIAEVFEKPASTDVARFFGIINSLRNDRESDSQSTVLVRPDALLVDEIIDSESRPSALESDYPGRAIRLSGVVDTCRFMGSHWETRIRLVDSSEWKPNSRSKHLVASENRARAAGERVSIRVPDEKMRIVGHTGIATDFDQSK